MHIINKYLNPLNSYKKRQPHKEQDIYLNSDSLTDDKNSDFDRKSDEIEKYFSFIKEEELNIISKDNKILEKDDLYKYMKSYNSLNKEINSKEITKIKIDVKI